MRIPGFAVLASCLVAATAGPLGAQGFGQAVAAGEGELFVAQPTAEAAPGAVYVYRNQGGEWTEAARLYAPDSTAGDHFGRALAVDGGTLLAGATVVDSTRGAAYLFRRQGGAWQQTARLQPSDLAADDAFGRSAALSGDLAAISTLAQDSSRGAVYVFRRGAGGEWTREGKLTASDAAAEQLFGYALAIGDDGRIAVGTPRATENSGAVYVFSSDGATGDWREEARLTAGDDPQNGGFGAALGFHGGHLLVGAPGVDQGRGAVFTFRRDTASGEWQEGARLLPFQVERPDQFGSSIAVRDGEVLIGAPGGADFAGRLFAFRQEDGEWASVRKVAGTEQESGDRLGGTLAVGSGIAISGMTGDDYGAGSAVIFERQDGGWTPVAKVIGDDTNFPAVTGTAVPCGAEGRASRFDCEKVDLVSFLPVGRIGGGRGVRVNDIWGWTDPETGTEWAIVGRLDGTAFVDVSDPSNPRYVGSLPKTEGSPGSTWRDMKVYKDHVFIVADGAEDHGMQVFDLTKLRDVQGDEPVTFEEDAHYDRIASAHNIVIDTATGYAYTVGNSAGGTTCGGGLHMINIENPTRPAFAGCFSDESTGRRKTGYTHDAQCVVYEGPDPDYQGREICFGANETALSIADVTDKESPTAIAAVSYPNVGYTHQGWLTEDQRYFFLDDELDEIQGTVENTRTLIWDVTDLDDPVLVGQYFGPTKSTDHNLYIVGDKMYQSNYVSGLRIVDVSEPENPREVGHFDTVPYGANDPGFGGSWSNYPFFDSGVVVVTSGSEGLFVLRPRQQELVP